MIRLATVGTSAICDKFLAGCALTGEYELRAVYSRTSERGAEFAEKHRCGKVYTDLEKMARDPEIDAVYIASPNACHAYQSKIFLSHGKHVICEKPITSCAAEYRELLALANSRGLVYIEAITSRHSGGRAALRDALGKIGAITVARIDYCQRSSRYDAFMRGEHVNIFDMSLGAGTLTDIGVYCVYGAVDLFGMPKSIRASASFLRGGADGAGCAIFEYDDFCAVLTYGKTGGSALGSEIIGDSGVLKIASISQYAGVTLVKDGEEREVADFPPRDVVMSGEARDFAAYINDAAVKRAEYEELCALTEKVHLCMDEIKSCAKIKYSQNKEYGI